MDKSRSYRGASNPNAKYEYDRSFLSNIDTTQKAYLLGWIASDGSIDKGQVVVAIHKKDIAVLADLRDIICPEIPLKTKKGLVSLAVYSKDVVADVCRHLDIDPGKKSDVLGFPDLKSPELTWAFIRGVFDGDGTINTPGKSKRSPRCSIRSDSRRFLKALYDFVSIPGWLGEDTVEWSGNNALDFLGKVYDGADYYLHRKKDLFVDWCTWVPSIRSSSRQEPLFRWAKADPRAVAPSKARVSDSGYDLTLIEKVKQVGNVEFYTTGVKLLPDYGWYFDLVGRSSISKSGYMIANSFGVIDRTYTGPVMVPLIKTDPNAPDLVLPNRLVQIIPRPICHFEFEEVVALDETARSDGGFGSTGVK